MKKGLVFLLAILSLYLTSCVMEGYTPNTSYVVTFNPNNGDAVFTQTVVGNQLITEPITPQYGDYNFQGWYTMDDVKWDFSINTVSFNTMLSAKWSLSEVVVDNKGYQDIIFNSSNVTFQNVHDINYYDGSSPTLGSPKVLVIPVEFSDALAKSKGYSISGIKNAFLSKQETLASLDYYSVYDYFYLSSYGKLSLDITVVDEWFKPSKPATYYANMTDEYHNPIGEQYVMDEALSYLASKYDLSQYDSNGDNVIDSVVLINTLKINEYSDFYWAFQYYNQVADNNGYLYEYDSVCADAYIWASYEFLFEDASGSYALPNPTNTYTYIHEFSHILGSEDYYDYSSLGNHPLEGYDVMDAMVADHNPFTKMHYGWITTSKLITTTNSVTLELTAFEDTGDTIIIAEKYDINKGVYQEYWVIAYYNATKLNQYPYGLFDAGVVVYHINANLSSDYLEGEKYYYLTNTNTDSSDEYGSINNLIEFVKNGDSFTYGPNTTLDSNIYNDHNQKIPYIFNIEAMNNRSVRITFTKNS